MQKLIFVLFRRAGLTHEQAMSEWSGERHSSIVRKVPGLNRWVQNHPAALPGDTAADAIGELCFESVQAMEQALASPEMAAAVDDARRFLDMERTYAFAADEKVLVDRSAQAILPA